MSDNELQPLLERLQRHYDGPVLPVSRILGAFRTWLDCVWRLHSREADEESHQPLYGRLYWRWAHQIAEDLERSQLLRRLLVDGEPLRTEKCPVHGGRWHMDAEACRHQCDGTGWLREPEGEPFVDYSKVGKAGALLRLLRERGEPAVPLSAFCAAAEAWMDCVRRLHTDPAFMEGTHQPLYAWAYWGDLGAMSADIRNSNLLARLLYAGEELRTEKCPLHDGHWNGEAMLYGCLHRCDGTGWLRNQPGDRGFRNLSLYRLEKTEDGEVGRVWDPESQDWGGHEFPWLRGDGS